MAMESQKVQNILVDARRLQKNLAKGSKYLAKYFVATKGGFNFLDKIFAKGIAIQLANVRGEVGRFIYTLNTLCETEESLSTEELQTTLGKLNENSEPPIVAVTQFAATQLLNPFLQHP